MQNEVANVSLSKAARQAIVRGTFAKIQANPALPVAIPAIKKGLEIIFLNQTDTEQLRADVEIHNGKGFRPQDAEFGTSLRNQLKTKGWLSPKQITCAARLLARYSRQIMEGSAQMNYGKPCVRVPKPKAEPKPRIVMDGPV